jgi:rod shape-determining protein MreD
VNGGGVNLPLRLAALGFLAVLVQIAAISQLTVFGVVIDLVPLLVASVGLLAGSLAGAAFGFSVGLFVDLALAQTLGVSSLLMIAIGYGAGRLRELRDPDGALVPLAVGAAAAAVATIGFSLMQFLLRSAGAPISLLLLRQIVVTILAGALFALPVYALARRTLQGSLPDDPRRRRRRAYTTGGLSPLQRPSAR